MIFLNPKDVAGDPIYNVFEGTGDVFHHFDLRLNGITVNGIPTPYNFFLVQAISGDCAMGAGIAKVINYRYHFRDSIVGDFAEGFPGFQRNGWIFDKNLGRFVNKSKSNGKTQTLFLNGSVGEVMTTPNVPHILGIVTKAHYYEKPSLDNMKEALFGLREEIERINHWPFIDDETEDNTIELIFPHIGCGLDGLNWEDVKNEILRTFEDMIYREEIQIVFIGKIRR